MDNAAQLSFIFRCKQEDLKERPKCYTPKCQGHGVYRDCEFKNVAGTCNCREVILEVLNDPKLVEAAVLNEKQRVSQPDWVYGYKSREKKT